MLFTSFLCNACNFQYLVLGWTTILLDPSLIHPSCFDKICFFLELVWKVARYTSAAPLVFNELDNYVDGGVIANNPSESGLMEIQNFHLQQGQKLPISLIVSVGSGVYPKQSLGSINAHEYLFGPRLMKAVNMFGNLIQLLANAVSAYTLFI